MDRLQIVIAKRCDFISCLKIVIDLPSLFIVIHKYLFKAWLSDGEILWTDLCKHFKESRNLSVI